MYFYIPVLGTFHKKYFSISSRKELEILEAGYTLAKFLMSSNI